MRRRRSEFGEVFMNSPAAVRQSEYGRRRLKVILCGSAHYPVLYTLLFGTEIGCIIWDYSGILLAGCCNNIMCLCTHSA